MAKNTRRGGGGGASRGGGAGGRGGGFPRPQRFPAVPRYDSATNQAPTNPSDQRQQRDTAKGGRFGRGGPSDPFKAQAGRGGPSDPYGVQSNTTGGGSYPDSRASRGPDRGSRRKPAGGTQSGGAYTPPRYGAVAGDTRPPLRTDGNGRILDQQPDPSGANVMLQRDRIQRESQASVNQAWQNPPLRQTAMQWEGGFQQQPRRGLTPADAAPIPAPDFNPPPDNAALGLGTVHREMPTGYLPVQDTIIYQLATAADDIPAWGAAPRARDIALRNFWPTEPVLAAAVYTLASKYASFGWTIEGPERTAAQVQKMLHGAERGAGWMQFTLKLITDFLTQDNGAFFEIVRMADNPLAPVVTISHLDASRCIRTGRWEEPVVYIDLWGVHHRMKWYQVAMLTELPSPVEMARGLQYCFVSRILKAAQIMRDMTMYMREKVSGRFNKAIHFVGGVQHQVINDALRQHNANADEQGLVRYIQPAIVASLDPNARVTVGSVQLASLPDNFNYDEWMKWYITEIAMAAGGDYQDFAPLSSGNLGSGAGGAQILHLKSRGKGAATFMRTMEQQFNFHGILPQNCVFSYGEQDTMANLEEVELEKERAQRRQIDIMSGVTTPEVERMTMLADGSLKQEQFDKLRTAPNMPPGPFPGGPIRMPDGTTTSPDKQPVAGQPGRPNPAQRVRGVAKKVTSSATPKGSTTSPMLVDSGTRRAPRGQGPVTKELEAARDALSATVDAYTAESDATAKLSKRMKAVADAVALSSQELAHAVAASSQGMAEQSRMVLEHLQRSAEAQAEQQPTKTIAKRTSTGAWEIEKVPV